MAVVPIAAMSSYDLEGGEDWTEYQERFEMFLIANGVDNEDKKRAVFLATIGVFKMGSTNGGCFERSQGSSWTHSYLRRLQGDN